MNGNYRHQDDLTEIKGIGATRAQWLQERFNVRSFGALAALSAADIEAKLHQEGKLVRQGAVEAWLEQAAALAKAAENKWHTAAEFVVYFQTKMTPDGKTQWQTKVDYMQEDRPQAWDGIARTQLCQWMVTQIEDQIGSESAAEQAAEAEEATAPITPQKPVRLKITDLEANQAMHTTADLLDSRQPFSLIARLELEADGRPSSDTFCIAQFHAHELSTGTRHHLGSTRRQTAAASIYSLQLDEATLPAGLYRFSVIAQLQGAPSTPSLFETPLVHVL